MNKIYFSKTTLSAYPEQLLDLYKNAGTLPDDLIELTDDEYQTYFVTSAPVNTKLSADKNGRPIFEDIEINLADVLTSSITRIDNIAATVTQKWARFAEEYKEREAAAIAYQDAGFTGDVSVYISSFASVAGKTNKEATLLILQQAQGLRTLQEQLAVQRMRKYELKQPKLSIEQIQTLTDEICANIQALGDSYE